MRERVAKVRGREALGWLKELTVGDSPDGEVVLLAPSEMVVSHVEATYGRLIREIWHKRMPDVVIRFSDSREPAPQTPGE